MKNYPTETYGRNLYVHTTNNDNTRQAWLCINRLPYLQDNDEQQLNEIRDVLNNITDEFGRKIDIIGLHRKYKGPLPTTLLLYKTTIIPAQDYLLNNTIDYKQNKLRTRLYINKTQIQCTNCNRLGHTKTNCTNEYKCVRCEESCPLNNCQNKNKRCTNCNGPHTATSRQCDKIRQHMNRRQQQNTTQTYAQALNKRQHELELTIQQQADTITELQSSVTELRQTITNLKTTEATNVKIRNTQIKEIKDKQQYTDALVGSHKLDTYALHDLEKEVRVNRPDIIKQIQVKINEHIANVEHYLKVIIPNLIAHKKY